MKAETNKTKTGKIASLGIVAAVVVGALAISGIADVTGGSMMSKLFILFLGAVIVLQIVPCMMLLAAMVKGVASLFHKKEKAAAGGEKK